MLVLTFEIIIHHLCKSKSIVIHCQYFAFQLDNRHETSHARSGDPGQGLAVSVGPIWHACIAICPAKHRTNVHTHSSVTLPLYLSSCHQLVVLVIPLPSIRFLNLSLYFLLSLARICAPLAFLMDKQIAYCIVDLYIDTIMHTTRANWHFDGTWVKYIALYIQTPADSMSGLICEIILARSCRDRFTFVLNEKFLSCFMPIVQS